MATLKGRFRRKMGQADWGDTKFFWLSQKFFHHTVVGLFCVFIFILSTT